MPGYAQLSNEVFNIIIMAREMLAAWPQCLSLNSVSVCACVCVSVHVCMYVYTGRKGADV